MHLTNGERNLKGEEKGNFIRKRALISKKKINIEQNIITNQASTNADFFRKVAYCAVGKNNCKCWACKEVGHYANECENRKNNKLIETLKSLHYVELSEDEALDLALSNNNGIVENYIGQ